MTPLRRPAAGLLAVAADRTVGSCSVVRLADGTWVVDGCTASVPNTPPT